MATVMAKMTISLARLYFYAIRVPYPKPAPGYLDHFLAACFDFEFMIQNIALHIFEKERVADAHHFAIYVEHLLPIGIFNS